MRRRDFIVLGAGTAMGLFPAGEPMDTTSITPETLARLTRRSAELRGLSTETVGPIVPALESHTKLLVRLARNAGIDMAMNLRRLAAEAAWLAANAHSDLSSDHQTLRWAGLAGKLAEEIHDQDLLAHAITRISRTYLSIDRVPESVAVLNRVPAPTLSPFGTARVEVHRALALSRHSGETRMARTRGALSALERAGHALLEEALRGTASRPEWIWWTDDEAFLRTWEAETLRSLGVPHLAEPVFRQAVRDAAAEDNRERPFLQAGLAEVIEQRGEVDEAADEAIRAIMMAHAVGADAALSRVHKVHAKLMDRAPRNSYVRSLGDALRDL